jgi:uncharacterized integral membrane protein (TIGR00697 family)
MANSLLFMGWAVLGLSILLLVFRFFGKTGVTAFIGASVVIMNILVTKSMIIFGLGATGGNILYASIFLATDILTEYYGGREARKAVVIGFVCSVFALIAISVTLLFEPADWDWAHAPLAAIFTPVARIVAGSMIAYMVSQNLDTYTYEFIRRRFKALWIRNNGSTWTSQLVDTLIFCTIGLLGTMPLSAWLQVVLSTYLLKIVVAALDTPFIYLSRLWKPRELKTSGQYQG